MMNYAHIFPRKQLLALILGSLVSIAGPLRSDTPKPTLVVLDLLSKGADSTEVSVITEGLRLQILKLGQFQLLERQRVKDILKEQEFSLTESTSDEMYVRLGRMLSVQTMIAGQVGKVGTIYSIYARVIDVETGTVPTMERVTARSIDEVYTKGVPQLVTKMFGGDIEPAVTAETSASRQPPVQADQQTLPPDQTKLVDFPTKKRPDPYSLYSPETTYRSQATGIEMIWVKDGTFTIGSSSTEKGRNADEGPQHSVTVSGFYLSSCEVTQQQYHAFDPDHQSYFEGDNRPVDGVSWLDAARFCNWLSEQEGLVTVYNADDLSRGSPEVGVNMEADGYRLPTEAEWEYACRAGKPSPFHTGQCITTEQANYDGEHPYRMCTKGISRKESWDVGSGSANAFGLTDMHGNVWEWCNDWYAAYTRESATNPAGPVRGVERVARGGSWYDYAESCRAAERESFSPNYAVNYLGFRLARR